MNYNMRLVLGVAAICLVAGMVGSAQGAATEISSTIVGFVDLTSAITNPSFETNVLSTLDTTGTLPAGWSHNTGAAGGYVYNPSSNQFLTYTDKNGRVQGKFGIQSALPQPIQVPGATSTPPTGYTVASNVGSQCMMMYSDCMMASNNLAIPGTSTKAHQTWVLTWEEAYPVKPLVAGYGYGGSTIGLWYSGSQNSTFFDCNDDVAYDSNHTGHYWGNGTMSAGYFYQLSWSFATDANSTFGGKTMDIKVGAGTNSSNFIVDNFHLYGYGNGITGAQVPAPPPPPTPEPSTLVLLMTGAVGMLAYAWRRKRKN